LHNFGFQFYVYQVKSGMRFDLFGLIYQDLGPNTNGQYFFFSQKKRNKTRREQWKASYAFL